MKNKIIATALLIVSVLMTGCASDSSQIAASHVSSVHYSKYDCDMLTTELNELTGRLGTLEKIADDKATNDAVVGSVAVIFFFPVALAMQGDGVEAQELAQVKGKINAIREKNIISQCGLVVPEIKVKELYTESDSQQNLIGDTPTGNY